MRASTLSNESRGVKKLNRTFYPMNLELASSDEVEFWVEVECNLDDGGEKPCRNARTAQQ